MLSPQQRRVLEGVLAGRANKEIAFDLGVSTKTVETHRARVMVKLEVESLAELVRPLHDRRHPLTHRDGAAASDHAFYYSRGQITREEPGWSACAKREASLPSSCPVGPYR
jgi:DNA-binding CsgD family transcriptional regulator